MTPAEEYAAALAAYTAAKARLIEAKRHYDHKNAPEAIAARRAKQQAYKARRNAPEAVAQREREWQESKERTARWIADYDRRHGMVRSGE